MKVLTYPEAGYPSRLSAVDVDFGEYPVLFLAPGPDDGQALYIAIDPTTAETGSREALIFIAADTYRISRVIDFDRSYGLDGIAATYQTLLRLKGSEYESMNLIFATLPALKVMP